MSIKKWLLLVGLCVLFTGCSTGSFESTATIPPTKEAVNKQTQLGVNYLLGRGVKQDDAKAFYYFNQAANRNDPFAQNEVAYLYASGRGVAKDYAQALFYYQKAAESGLASAQYNLGMLYFYGLGTPVNKSLAREWYQKAAAKNFEPAKVALARNNFE